jgi:predicted phage terminase large subunit-like protein
MKIPIPPISQIQAERRKRAKASLGYWGRLHGFVPARHHDLLIEKLEAVERGELPRLMVCMPPGSAKSTWASVLFPPWYMGRNPTKNIITASYAQRLSRRFGKRCRNIVASENFRETFGFPLASDAAAADEWETEAGGEFSATSVGGAVTGRRADGILVDDPIKGRKEADSLLIRDNTWDWWVSDLRTRLKPGGFIVLILTRWHEDDPAGRILPENWDGRSGFVTSRDGEHWYVLSIQAEAETGDPLGREPGEMLWPEWFSDGMLAREKIAQGPRNWNALYQQKPSAEEGDYFKKDWIRYYDQLPPKETMRFYGASDYAVTSDGGDYTVHGVLGLDPDGRMYLADLWRAQASADAWVEAWCDLVLDWRPLGWAEETGQIKSGVGPFRDQRARERKAFVACETFPTRGDKSVRAQSIRGRCALNGLYLPRRAAWVPGLVSELLSFPAGKHDDQVDMLGLLGQLLDKMVAGAKPRASTPRPKRGGWDEAFKDTKSDSWKVA